MKKISFDSCEVCFSEWGTNRVGFGGSGTRLVYLCGVCLHLMSMQQFGEVENRKVKARTFKEPKKRIKGICEIPDSFFGAPVRMSKFYKGAKCK